MRKLEGVRGYTKDMVLHQVNEELTQKIATHVPEEIVIVTDTSLKISPDDLEEEFKAAGSGNVAQVLILPANTSKIINPLDNAMWADVKRKIRNRRPKTAKEFGQLFEQVLKTTFASRIRAWYRKCGVLPGTDVHRDL